MNKDTIYIDPEDDITGIIDRVNSAKAPIVAAVLPKRAQMLHSSVNMRLLKRAAESNKKRLVLITSEAPVLKLAAAVRVHVAKSLTSKPALPSIPKDDIAETILADEVEEVPLDKKKAVGELAGDKASTAAAVSPAVIDLAEDEETIELDNAEDETVSSAVPVTAAVKKDKRLKVPNFDKFRTRLFLGIGAGVLVLVAVFLALFVLPKATIVVRTETNDLETKFDFTANAGAQALDETTKVFPAQSKEVKQTITEKFQSTGSLDKGTKATGSVNLQNCNKDDETITLPANTRLLVGDAAFRTDEAVTLSANTTASGLCLSSPKEVDVTAEQGGDKYNLSARNGYYAPDFPDIKGTGDNMKGGTSNVVKAVTQSDVDAVTQKIMGRSTDEDKQQLMTLLKAANQFPLDQTFTATPEPAVVSPAVGQEGNEGAVVIVISYQMLGVAQTDLETVLKKEQENKINTQTQKIYDNGLDKARIGQLERKSPTESKLAFTTTAVSGPQLDAAVIAKEIAGKSGGETKKIIESRPGITGTDVRYSPFWVLKTPKKLSRITITFDGSNQVR